MTDRIEPPTAGAPAPDAAAWQPLHPAATRIWRIASVPWVLLPGLGAVVVVVLVVGSPLVTSLVAVTAAIASGIAWWYPALQTRHWRYRIGDEALELRHGVWWRSSAAVPFHRIQQIDVEQGPVQRRHDVVSLRLRTAAAFTVGTVPHLAAADAELVRTRLLAAARAAVAHDDGH
ncbi:MAG: PH domain-containing protein [Acidimicrobiales bacterium]|nr:PH domain-containing protein [Acidimicrobiales bacterium]MCB9395126.1 PH domain-containing protein [Acidimicrobiaceae bacterium]